MNRTLAGILASGVALAVIGPIAVSSALPSALGATPSMTPAASARSLPAASAAAAPEASVSGHVEQARAKASPQARPALDLAKGRAVTASSAARKHGAKLAADGKSRTFWQSRGSAKKHWIKIDLGTTARVGEVALRLPKAKEKRAFVVSVAGALRGDGGWTTLSKPRAFTFGSGQRGEAITDVSDASVRFVRVRIALRESGKAAARPISIGTLSVRAAEGVDGAATFGRSANVAVGGRPRATGTQRGTKARAAIDGNLATAWQSRRGVRQPKLTVALRSAAPVRGIRACQVVCVSGFCSVSRGRAGCGRGRRARVGRGLASSSS